MKPNIQRTARVLTERWRQPRLRSLKLERPLKKLLTSMNPQYGLHGELRRVVPGQEDAVWQSIANGIQDTHPSFGTVVLRNYLDSKYGRQLYADLAHLIIDQDEIDLDYVREEARRAAANDIVRKNLERVADQTDRGVFSKEAKPDGVSADGDGDDGGKD